MKRTWIPYLILMMLLAFAIPLVTVATPTTTQHFDTTAIQTNTTSLVASPALAPQNIGQVTMTTSSDAVTMTSVDATLKKVSAHASHGLGFDIQVVTAISPPVCGLFYNSNTSSVKQDKMMTAVQYQSALNEGIVVISNVVGVIGKQVQNFSLTYCYAIV